jgi:type I restriction enzyme R subunit
MSIFAFTATPKDKTMELFGTKDKDGIFKPFYQYSHNQAVSEGMILDVLSGSITTYERKESLQDPELDKIYNDSSYAARVLREEVNNNPKIIALECKYDLAHFFNNVEKELDHTAKIMIISSSRKNAQLRAKILTQQLAERGSNLKVLAGYSGELSTIEEDPEEKKLTTNDINNTFSKESEVALSRNYPHLFPRRHISQNAELPCVQATLRLFY